MSETWLLDRLLLWIPLVLSLSLHEWAHAACANALGDDTAARQGRLTLNPLEHMDPVGSCLLPLLGVPFGWAKPVPIDFSRFRCGADTGIVLTAAAGPLSNLALALVATLAAALGAGLGWMTPGAGSAAWQLAHTTVLLNLLLACFNLLPIPPLDGSRVVDGLIPDGWRGTWDAFARLAPLALVAVLVAPILAGVSLLAWPEAWAGALLQAAAGVAGVAGTG